MIGYRDLHTDHRRDQDDIPLDTAGDRRRRVAVGRGQCIHRHAFLVQCTGLRHQVLEASRDAVCAQKPDDGGDAVLKKGAEGRLRYAGCRSLFSAATGDMDMQIDVGRHEGFSREIIDLDIRKVIIACDFFRDPKDLLSLDQHISFTERRWCVNAGIL